MQLRLSVALIALTVLAKVAIGQNIKPYDLIQVYEVSQLQEPKYGQNTFTYLRNNVDANWKPTGYPTIDKDGTYVDFEYLKDGTDWDKPCDVMIYHKYGPPDQKQVIYTFKDSQTWDAYNNQMTLMNAQVVGKGDAKGGGTNVIYRVNDIVFILSEYPPGINAIERSYTVAIMPNSN